MKQKLSKQGIEIVDRKQGIEIVDRKNNNNGDDRQNSNNVNMIYYRY